MADGIRCALCVVRRYALEEGLPVSGVEVIARWLVPDCVDRVVLPLRVGKALRAFADGYVAVLLPA